MPCTLTSRAWISANLILQTLSPEDVIEIATSTGSWTITDDRPIPAAAGVQA